MTDKENKPPCEWHSNENIKNWIDNGINKCPYCGMLIFTNKQEPVIPISAIEPIIISCPDCKNKVSLDRNVGGKCEECEITFGPPMDSVPFSVIDAKIAKFHKELKDSDYIMKDFTEADRIKLLLWELEDLKKEAK